MKKVILISIVAVTLLLLVGCAKPPEAEIAAANAAMTTLRTAEAETYAPQALKTATDTLNAANSAKAEADAKFALFRSYKKAAALYKSAEKYAAQATQDAAAGKERARVEVTELMNQVTAALAVADSVLAKAPVGKGNKADIELIKNDLAAAHNALPAAQRDIDATKYMVAKPKLDSIMNKTKSIMQEIERAAAMKSGKK
jgi:hypothetical protein